MPTTILRRALPPLLLLGGAVGLKLWGRNASSSDLDFLLRPVSRVLELFTGHEAQATTEGYLFPGLGILIDTSCSGLTFMAITWATFGLLLLRRAMSGCWAPYLAACSGIVAYLLTLLANSGRILSLTALHRMGITLGQKQHEAVGAFCFVLLLLLVSTAFDRHLANRCTHAPQP